VGVEVAGRSHNGRRLPTELGLVPYPKARTQDVLEQGGETPGQMAIRTVATILRNRFHHQHPNLGFHDVMEATVNPCPRGPDWMPITPNTGSLFHAETQD
jgi:hypothetical protein